MKRKPNKPKQEPRERPGSWEEPADPGGAGPLGAAPQAVPGLGTLLDKVSTSQSFGRKANRSRPPRLSSAWKSAGKSWNGQRISWQNRSPRKSRARSGGWAAPLAGPPTVLCMGRFTKTSRKTWASRGPTAPSWWASPPCGMAPGL